MDTYEEKYKQALGKALELYNQGLINPPLEHIFPELKESGDEKIRKEMIFYFTEEMPQCSIQEHSDKMREFILWLKRQEVERLELKAGNSYFCYKSRWERADNETFKKGLIYKCNKDGVLDNFVIKNPEQHFIEIKDKRIAWLEKQEDYIKLPNSAYTSNSDVIEFADKYSHTVWEKLMDNFKKIENYSIGCNDVSDLVLNAIINTYNWLEKQGEKLDAKLGQSEVTKTSDKEPEPKFKVGDWIIDKSGLAQQVLDFKGGIYTCTYNSFTTDCESNYHLWRIQDAKDGDVLVDSYSKDSIIILYKGINKERTILAYCGWNGYNFSIKTNGLGYGGLDNTNYLPATKEQRELFFEKMNEAGYEWDSENKKVKKKIEPLHVGEGFIKQVREVHEYPIATKESIRKALMNISNKEYEELWKVTFGETYKEFVDKLLDN